MNNQNLTQAEAAARSELLAVESYDVHIDLTNAAEADFTSYPTATTVRFSAKEGAKTFIDYIHHSVDSVKLNGTHLNIHEVVEGSRIKLTNLGAENVLTIMGSSLYSRSGEGLHRYFDPKDGKVYLYTQYEPADCRRVFPNFEQPDLKAVFNFRITAPKNWVVSSNAPLDRVIEDPSDSSITKRVFKPTEKISTYITAILAGEYFVATDTYKPQSAVNSGPIPLVAYCRQSLKDHFDYDDIFKVTKNGLDFYQNLFDYAYPYHKYEQAFVPEYNLGAMENPGLVTFTESYLFEAGATEAQLEARANVICHEMSHMWFGDLVTMQWWNDLWLKESFAEYMGTLGAYEAGGYKDAWVSFANSRKAWAYNQDQLPTTHPIVADIPHLEAARQNFDGITYAKGSSVLKQLVAYVGFDTFIDAARIYFKRHAWGNTTLDDFLAALDEASERDVFTWARAWLQTEGLSTLSTERVYDAAGQLSELYICQQLPSQVAAELGRPHQLKLETFTKAQEKLVSSGIIDVEIPAGDAPRTRVQLSPDQLAQVADADLLVLNAEDLTYAKVILSEEDGLQTALDLVSTLDSALTRGLVWGSLWNQVRDALLPAHRFVHAVENNISAEPSSTLLANLLLQAQGAISNYAPLAKRQQLRDSLYDACARALENAEASSDAQLIIVRAMLSLASNTEHGLDFAQDLARGAYESTAGADLAAAPGLAYNQTLGWSALVALANQGRVGLAELDQARQFNSSSVSERGYAFAKAAIPSAESKAEAFTAVIEDMELSNEILSATAQGFQEGAAQLHEPYVEPYFAALTDTWEKRSIGMATRVVQGLFPASNYVEGQDIEEHPTVAKAKKWLEENTDAPTALQRLLLENLDSARRSLRGQKFNSSTD